MSKLHVVTGPMFAGKTEFILQRIKRAKFANQGIQIFLPVLDTRNQGRVISHAGNHLEQYGYKPTIITNSAELSKRVRPQTNLVVIEETQFIPDGPVLYRELEIMLQKGLEILVSGLDRDYLNRPFGPMPILMALADTITKLTAICVNCGGDANCSYRKSVEADTVLIGGQDEYEARCRKCFIQKPTPGL